MRCGRVGLPAGPYAGAARRRSCVTCGENENCVHAGVRGQQRRLTRLHAAGGLRGRCTTQCCRDQPIRRRQGAEPGVAPCYSTTVPQRGAASPVWAHRLWVVNMPEKGSAQTGVLSNLNVEAYAEVASTGKGLATPRPAATEAATDSVNDDQESAPAQLPTDGPDGGREAPPVPRAPIEEVSGTRVGLASEPENDPVSPVVPGRTEKPHIRLWVIEYDVHCEGHHGVRVFTRSEEHPNNLRPRIQKGFRSDCGGEFHFRAPDGICGHAVACREVSPEEIRNDDDIALGVTIRTTTG